MPFCLHLPPFTCRVAPKARRHEVSRSVVHGGDTPPGEKVSAFRFRLCGGRSATRTANASFRTQPCEFTRVPACKYLFFWLHASAELLHAALECLSTLTSFACGVDFCHLASIICLPCSRRIPARELENCPVSMSMSKKARTSTPADDEEQALWRKHGRLMCDSMAGSLEKKCISGYKHVSFHRAKGKGVAQVRRQEI